MRKFRFIAIVFLASFSFPACDELNDLLSDDPRDAFVGDWSVKEENTLKSTDYYNVTIRKSESDTSLVIIENFYQLSYSTEVEAKVTGSNITIASQTVSAAGSDFKIQGYGSMPFNGKTIGWSYTVDYLNDYVDQVTATFTRED